MSVMTATEPRSPELHIPPGGAHHPSAKPVGELETYWNAFDAQPVRSGVIWNLEPIRFLYFGHPLCKKGDACVNSPELVTSHKMNK